MWRLIYKDLLLPLRSSNYLWAFVINNILLVFILSLAIPLEYIRDLAIGMFWAVNFINASQFTLKVVEDEFEDDAIYSVLMSSLSHGHIALSKIFATFLYLVLASLVNLSAIVVLFRVQKPFPPSFWLFLLIGLAGIAVIGLLISLITIRLTFRTLSFYILSLPLYVPFFIACVQGSMEFRLGWAMLALFLISAYMFILLSYMEREL